MMRDMEFFENITEKEILKIELRKAVDLPEYVEFSDQDLIEEISSYLQSIKIKSVSKHTDDINGGKKVIKIYFKDFRYKFIEISENKIKIGETNYLVEVINNDILNKIYQKSIERGYLKSNN